jgi:hypothetical protein
MLEKVLSMNATERSGFNSGRYSVRQGRIEKEKMKMNIGVR